MKRGVALVLLLAACSNWPQPLPPPSYQTIDPIQYLVQSRVCDGDVHNPLHRDDPITCRRMDFGDHQISDAFLNPDGSTILTWDFPPFGPFHPPQDGGERMIEVGSTTLIDSTEDGGTPFVTQYFVGRHCGGTGWVAFRNDATPQPKSLVARLNISRGNPNACSANSQAWTQYWTADVNYPRLGVIPTVISEHYNTGDVNRANAMERFFWGKGWGRLVWQAWRRGALPPGIPVPDLPQRCPDFGYNAPPRPGGWTMVDCRQTVNIVPANGHLTGAQLWHPR